MQGWHQFPVNYWSPFCVMYLDGKLLRNTSCCHNQVTDSVLVSKHLGPSFSHHEISVNANSERVAHKIAHTWLQCQANIKHFNIPEPVTRVRDILIHCREKEGWEKKRYPKFCRTAISQAKYFGHSLHIYLHVHVKYKPVKKILRSFGILLQANVKVFIWCGFSSNFNLIYSMTLRNTVHLLRQKMWKVYIPVRNNLFSL